MERKKTILLVDDHSLLRIGLKAIIGADKGLEVVGEAVNAAEGYRLAEKFGPDLVIVDISLPDKSGIELTSEIRASMPETRVMILSMHTKTEYIKEAFRAGATGYMVKETSPENLLRGIDRVLIGEYFMDSHVTQQVVTNLSRVPPEKIRNTDPSYSSLSPREQQVLRLLVEGSHVKEIAAKLFISPKTVESHKINIMKKLKLKKTLDLVRYAARIGLIDVDTWKY